MFQKQNLTTFIDNKKRSKKEEKKELVEPVTCAECIDLYVRCLKSVIAEEKDTKNECWKNFSNCLEDCNPVNQPQFLFYTFVRHGTNPC